MDIDAEAKKLSKSRLLKTKEEIATFEKAVVNILSMNDANHIKLLCSGFDDSSEHDEVMFGLIHAIESYDKTNGPGTSLRKFAESIPEMFPHAKEWAKIFHKRILNHEPTSKMYATVIRNVDSTIRTIVIDLMYEIKKRNPKKFELQVDKFLAELR